MVCKHCGAENPENAVFCMVCGQRVDGMTPCPHCGTPNPPEAVYCVSCGTRIDGKRVCPSCGTVLEETSRFCYVCGHAFEEKPAAKDEAHAEETSSHAPKKTRAEWLSLFGGVGMLLAAFFSLVFVFCIGLSVSVNGANASDGGSLQSVGTFGISADGFLYQYFGDVYKNIGASMEGITQDGGYLALASYLPAVLGTVVSAGAIISVPVCFALAAVRFVRTVRDTDGNKNYIAPAVAAFCTFLFAACFILAINYVSYTVSASGYGASISVGFNGATLAGIILGGIFLVAGYALRVAAKGKEAVAPASIRSLSLVALGIVLVAIVLVFAASGGMIYSVEGTAVGTIPAVYMQQVGARFITNRLAPVPVGEAVTFMLSLFAQIGTLGCAAFLLIALIGKDETRKKLRLRLSVALFLCAVVYLAMTIVFGKLASDYMLLDATGQITEDAVGMEFAYTAPIVATVFAAVMLAVSTVDTVLSKKSSQNG